MADMRELPVVGRFDLVTCLDDALNHLPSAADVERALRAIGAPLAPDGLLAFDVNTLTAYRETADRIVEDGERIVLWHGGPARLDAPGGRAVVSMDVMSRRGDGLWRRASASWATGTTRSPRSRRRRRRRARAPGGPRAAVRRAAGPIADETRHQKALFLVRRARREGGHMPWQP